MIPKKFDLIVIFNDSFTKVIWGKGGNYIPDAFFL